MLFSCFQPCLPRHHFNFDILYLTFGFSNIYTVGLTLCALFMPFNGSKNVHGTLWGEEGAATKENATLHCREGPFNLWLPGNTLTAKTFGRRKHLLTLYRAKRRHKTEAITYYLSIYADMHDLPTHCVKCANKATL